MVCGRKAQACKEVPLLIPPSEEPARLTGSLGPWQYFALGFGCIVGSGWLIVVGQWLALAGPGGAALGFLMGGAMIAVIGWSYADLTRAMPEAGGDFLYALNKLGRFPGFLVGWFLLLYYVATCAFEGVALGSVAQMLAPGLLAEPLYTIGKTGVSPMAILVGLTAGSSIFILNSWGIRAAARFQAIATYGFLAVAICILALVGLHGHAANLSPFIVSQAAAEPWQGVLTVFVISIFMMDGFQAVAQAVEERSPHAPMHVVSRGIALSILAGTLFYVFAILANGLALPRPQIAGKPLATAIAAHALPGGSLLVTALLLAGMASLLKTWNAMTIMAVRLLVAMSRHGFTPRVFARLSGPGQVPFAAIAVVSTCSLAGLMFGRAAIDPIIAMASITLGFVYGGTCLVALRLRFHAGPRAFAMPAAGIGASTLIIGIAIPEPFRHSSGLPVEYAILIGWLIAGLAYWIMVQRRRPG